MATSGTTAFNLDLPRLLKRRGSVPGAKCVLGMIYVLLVGL